MTKYTIATILLATSAVNVVVVHGQTTAPTKSPTEQPTTSPTSSPTTNFFVPDYSAGTCTDDDTKMSQFLIDTFGGVYDTLTECCQGKFPSGQQYNDCITGGGGTILGSAKWYPKWDGSDDDRCAKDCDPDVGAGGSGPDSACGGILGKGQGDRYDTAEACCIARFSYEVTGYCVAKAEGTTYTGTNKWVVDWSEHVCLQDCPPGALPCGGVVDESYRTLYDSLADCCSSELPSLNSDFCEAQVNPATSTNKWFAGTGTKGDRCVKDCTGSSDVCEEFSGFGTLYDTAKDCCEQAGSINWVNDYFCESRSDPLTYGVGGAAYSSKWFYDKGELCSKDCDSSAAGASAACSENLAASDTVYDSALECCEEKISWTDSTVCEVASIAGSAADAPATNKFYADYSTGIMRCVKDCDDTSTDPQCADSKLESIVGVQLFDDAEACCDKKFGWYQSDLCQALVASGGEATNTGKWEANYMEETCTQDCPVSSSNPTCGGTPKDLSQPLYASMEDCCKQKFSWMGDSCMCKADPTLTVCVEAATKWYASDKDNGKCKRNCDDSADDECGGMASVGQTLFDSAEECCDPSNNTRFTGQTAIQNCECQGIDPNDTTLCVAAAGDNRWYVKGTKCVKNCPTGSDDECGGLADSWVWNFFSSASACCDTSQFQGIEFEDCIG